MQPPVKIHVSRGTDSVDEAKRLPPVTQPAALTHDLRDLQEGTTNARIEKLKRKVLADLVSLPGGAYMMGDFGTLVTEEKLPLTFSTDNKPLHKVTLSSFSISRYKTTFAEYDVFLDANKIPHIDDDVVPYRNPYVPAGALWQQAKDYCQWLGKITGVPFDLPTESQWEYAARSGGRNFVFATSDGNLERGRNIDDYYQLKLISPVSDSKDKWGNTTQVRTYPVGIFPPNPVGLYDMNHDGYEWMNDWYQADYYKISPQLDPKGPSSGQWKVVRSAPIGEPVGYYNNNLTRNAWDPTLNVDRRSGRPHVDAVTGEPAPFWAGGFSWRCVVNSDQHFK